MPDDKPAQDKNGASKYPPFPPTKPVGKSEAADAEDKPFQSTFWTNYIEQKKKQGPAKSPLTNYIEQKKKEDAAKSPFWSNLLEQKKKQDAAAGKTPKSNGSVAGTSEKKSPYAIPKPKPMEPDRPLKIKNEKLTVSALEKKKQEYQRKLLNTTNLLLLLLKTDKRIHGRENITYVLSMKSRDDPKVKKYYVFCTLLKQFVLGAIGGIVVGFQTRFLFPSRFPTPHTLLPVSWNLPLTRKTCEMLVMSGSVVWRMCKRGVIAGLVFDNVDRKVEEYRNRRDWINTAIAGGISGSVFGLRGGFYGPLHSSATFAIIGALGGYFYVNPPAQNNKPDDFFALKAYDNYRKQISEMKKKPCNKDN